MFYSSEGLRKVFEETAEHLTGKTILFQFRNPPTQGALGECYRTADFLTCIDLAPGLGIEKTYKIFLHETAHALLHVADMKPTEDHMTAPGSIQIAEYSNFVQSIANKSELEANELAGRWMRWAEQMTKNVFKNEHSTEARIIGYLTALSYYTGVME
jgi:hypothetical protein